MIGTLTQTGITGWNAGAALSGSAQLTFDVTWTDGIAPGLTSTATLDVTVGGVLYARVTTSAGSLTTGSITYFNNASGPVNTMIAGVANGLIINLPDSVAASGSLVFSYFGSGSADNISIDNVSALTSTDATVGNNFSTTFVENGPAVSIADTDSSVRDVDSANVVSAVIILTNAQTGDSLAIAGALPPGIGSSISSAPGQITVTLTGSATKATYDSAIRQIQFANSLDVPNTSVVRNVTVQVSDGFLSSNVATTSINVVATNDPPLATDDNFSITENGISFGNVINSNNGNGVDSDPEGNALVVAAVNGSAANVGVAIAGSSGGMFTVQSNGSYLFNPGTAFDYLAVGQTATTTVTYTISDGNGGTSTATVTVTVNGQNDAPINAATIPAQSSNDSDPVTLNISGFFSDPDTTDVLSFSAGGLPTGLSINATSGMISGTIDANASQNGPYSVTITVDDRNGGSSTQSFLWKVADPIPPSPADNFAFDSFTNQALSGFDNGSGRVGLVDRCEFREILLSSRLYQLAPEPIMAGYGAPGSILVGRIYDSSGALVGESSATASLAGNWVMQFFGVTAHANTRVVIEHVSSEQLQHDNVHYFRLTGDTYRSLQLGASHEQAYNIGSILADAPSTSLQAAVWENLQPLLLM